MPFDTPPPKNSLPVVMSEYMALDGVELKSPQKIMAGDRLWLQAARMASIA
jgi:hypothetical protein